MNILLITEEYFSYPNQSRLEISHVISNHMRNFVIKGINVTVIRPQRYYNFFFNIFKKARKARKLHQEETFAIDGVNILRFGFLAFPRKKIENKIIHKTMPRIIEKISAFKPDVILVHMIEPALNIANQICKQFNSLPIVLTLHNYDDHYLNHLRFKEEFIKEKFENVKSLGFSSEVLRNRFNGYKLDLSDKILNTFINRYGLDEIWFKQVQINDINYNNPKLITVSYLYKLKRIDFIIKCINDIDSKLNYEIIGNGPEKRRLINLVNKLNLTNKINFHGEKSPEEILSILDKSDVFVLLSFPETLGLVYIEAMARGKIVIGSRGQGIDGIIIDGFNGFLCNPTDKKKLQDILRFVLNPLNHFRIHKIRLNAIRTANNYSSENVSEEYLSEIKKVL